jgi:hypothetical protein
MSDGYADDEIPLWVARPSDQRDEHTLGADEQRSDALDPDVQRSAALRSAITRKHSPNSIPRYPGQQSRAERVPTEHNAFQRRSTGADQLLNALNRGGTVSTTEYSTLELLNTDQLAQLNPVRMPNGTIGRIHARAHLQMCAHSECLVVVGILNVYDLYG